MTVLAMLTTAICYFVSNIFQNRFSKSLAGRKYPLPLFQGLWMGIATIFMLVMKLFAGSFHLSPDTIMISIFSGAFVALGGMMLVLALEKGPMSLTILLFSVNSVIPTLLSILLLKESTTIFQIIGMILILVVIVLINLNQEELGMKIERGWLLYTVLSFLFTGLCSFCTKLHQSRLPNLEQEEYSILLFASGSIIMMVCYVYLKKRNKKDGAERYPFSIADFYLPAMVVAVVQGTAMLCSLYNSSRMPAIIFFPVTQLLVLILITVFSVLCLGERPKRKTVVCMLIGVIAIVIMNF